MESFISIAMGSGIPASLLLVRACGRDLMDVAHKDGLYDGVDGSIYRACRLAEGDISQLQSQAGWFPQIMATAVKLLVAIRRS